MILAGGTVGAGHVKTPEAGPRDSLSEHSQPTAVAETFPQVQGSTSHFSPFFRVPVFLPVFGCWLKADDPTINDTTAQPIANNRIIGFRFLFVV